jgi:hypothetical protein
MNEILAGRAGDGAHAALHHSVVTDVSLLVGGPESDVLRVEGAVGDDRLSLQFLPVDTIGGHVGAEPGRPVLLDDLLALVRRFPADPVGLLGILQAAEGLVFLSAGHAGAGVNEGGEVVVDD